MSTLGYDLNLMEDFKNQAKDQQEQLEQDCTNGIQALATDLSNGTYRSHPEAEKYPMLDAKAYKELRDDIKKNGIVTPIIMDKLGRVVDGRNRLKAALDLWKFNPPSDALGLGSQIRAHPKRGKGRGLSINVNFLFDNDIPEKVTSLNLHRRHLTAAQKVAVVEAMFAKQGRRKATKADASAKGNAAQGNNVPTAPGRLREPEPYTVAEVAEVAKVGERTVERINKVQDADPELHKKVVAGEVSAKAAEAQVKAKAKPKAKTKAEPVETLTAEDEMAATIIAAIDSGGITWTKLLAALFALRPVLRTIMEGK